MEDDCDSWEGDVWPDNWVMIAYIAQPVIIIIEQNQGENQWRINSAFLCSLDIYLQLSSGSEKHFHFLSL